jgi:copper chaperone NosL
MSSSDGWLSARRLLVLVAALATFACAAPGPGVFHYDVDACDHCRMTIADARFAAQIVTRTGKIYRFDDPGCVVAFLASNRVAAADVHSIWLNDYSHPDTLVDARNAVFVVSDRIKAPMNGGMATFGSRTEATSLQATVGGLLRNWSEILARPSS